MALDELNLPASESMASIHSFRETLVLETAIGHLREV